MKTWRVMIGFVLGCIASGHYYTNVFKTNFSKKAHRNFILFVAWMENKFSGALILVRHCAVFFLKSVFTSFVLLWPLVLHFGTKLLVFTAHISISSNGCKSGRHDGGLIPFHRQLNLLLLCKSYSQFYRAYFENCYLKILMPYMRLWQKMWSLLLKYHIHLLSKQVIQGGMMAD